MYDCPSLVIDLTLVLMHVTSSHREQWHVPSSIVAVPQDSCPWSFMLHHLFLCLSGSSVKVAWGVLVDRATNCRLVVVGGDEVCYRVFTLR